MAFRQPNINLLFVLIKTMDLDASKLALGGAVVFVVFTFMNSYSTLRANRRYGTLGANPPAVVSSNLFGILFFLTLNI